MEKLTIGNVAIATVIVGILDLIAVVLVRTETILKIVERIKGVVGLDYRNRAKRSADELRISKLHAEVAKERVRNTFVTMNKWNCRWVWNWSDSFEPINIKGYCTGDAEGVGIDRVTYTCNNPVYGGYWYHEKPKDEQSTPLVTFRIVCTDSTTGVHSPFRESFTMYTTDTDGDSGVMLNSLMAKAILSERDVLIAKEIKKLRLQFWR